MFSVLSRNQTPASTHPPRTLRKSFSFLSLRREKDKATLDSSVEETPLHVAGSSSSHHIQQSPFLGQHSRPKSSPASRLPKGKSKYTPSPRAILLPTQRSRDTNVRPSTSPRTGDDSAFVFPTFESSGDIPMPTASSYTYVRTRSQTGPSGKSHWDNVSSTARLRFSRSSSTQHTETPLRIPIDYATSRESFEQFPVVAAPAAGVDAMDALVDGMNGGEGGSLSGRAKFGIPHHHPLYQPPLPTPPPGIVLGGGKPRRTKPKHVENPPTDSNDAEDHPRNMSGAARKARK
jgi:hypothetical protein